MQDRVKRAALLRGAVPIQNRMRDADDFEANYLRRLLNDGPLVDGRQPRDLRPFDGSF